MCTGGVLLVCGQRRTTHLKGVTLYGTTIVVSGKSRVTLTDCYLEAAMHGVAMVACGGAQLLLQNCKFEGGLQVSTVRTMCYLLQLLHYTWNSMKAVMARSTHHPTTSIEWHNCTADNTSNHS